jgi:cytidylate kinase
MASRVICISHATGSGGQEVGRLVADALGFLYVDDEIVARAAAAGGIDRAEVEDEERRKSLAARLLDGVAQGGEAWALGHGHSSGANMPLSSDHVRRLITETVVQTAARGDVVIVAHGASHLVAPSQAALRVLVTASPETRAARIGEQQGLEPKASARVVKDSDAGRRDYLMRFYDVDEELPTQYDLVVNTDTISLDGAATVVVHAATV